MDTETRSAQVTNKSANPGLYKVSGLPAQVGEVVRLTTDGEWWWIGNEYMVAPELLYPSDLPDHGLLARMEPVQDVLDALAEYLDGQLSGRTKKDIIGHLSEKFGVPNV